MANPQKENGYTPIANEIIEKIAFFPLNATQYKIVMLVWRYTYGFSRKGHELSETFISNAIGVSKRYIRSELKDLIDINIIKVDHEATFKTARVLSFNKNYDEWINTIKTERNNSSSLDESFRSPEEQSFRSPEEQSFPQDKQYIKTNIKTKESIVSVDTIDESISISEECDSINPEIPPYKQIMESFNSICNTMPKIKSISGNRQKKVRSVWREVKSLEYFNELFECAARSDFLNGSNGKWTNCSFDWIIEPANRTKIMEGNYENRGSPGKESKVTQINNFKARNYEDLDFSDLYANKAQ